MWIWCTATAPSITYGKVMPMLQDIKNTGTDILSTNIDLLYVILKGTPIW